MTFDPTNLPQRLHLAEAIRCYIKDKNIPLAFNKKPAGEPIDCLLTRLKTFKTDNRPGGVHIDRNTIREIASPRKTNPTRSTQPQWQPSWKRNGDKRVLGLVEGATENAAAEQAALDNLVARGLDPTVPRLIILDGEKALSMAVKATFGRTTPIQRCQVHKAATSPSAVRRSTSPASARRCLGAGRRERDRAAHQGAREAPGVCGSLLEGLNEILTVPHWSVAEPFR